MNMGGSILLAKSGSKLMAIDNTLVAKLDDLGTTPSYSRPRVSNDNPNSESLFRTMKYYTQWPSQGFKTIEESRVWVQKFVKWYNNDHKHSKIGFVTPAQRHEGQDVEILEKRKRVYEQVREKHLNVGLEQQETGIGLLA